MTAYTTKTVAKALDGWVYGEKCPLSEGLLKSAGIVVVTGSSDDLIEFSGAISDEFGCGDGTQFRLDREGVLSPFDDVPHSESEMREYFRREATALTVITAHWGRNNYPWSFDITDRVRHVEFNMLLPKDEREEGESPNYCRGMVFRLEDL